MSAFFQLSTFIRQLVFLMTHGLQNKVPTRIIKLSEDIWFIMEVLSVQKDVMLLLFALKFNNHCALFYQTVTCLQITEFHLMTETLQILLSWTSSPIEAGIGFISKDSKWWCSALLTRSSPTGPFFPSTSTYSFY